VDSRGALASRTLGIESRAVNIRHVDTRGTGRDVGGLWQEREGRRSVKVRSPGVTGPNGAQRFLHLRLAQMSTSVVGQRQCPLHDEVVPTRVGSARTVLEIDEAVSNGSDGLWTIACKALWLLAIDPSLRRAVEDVVGDRRGDLLMLLLVSPHNASTPTYRLAAFT
jgi:hypothetical protein